MAPDKVRAAFDGGNLIDGGNLRYPPECRTKAILPNNGVKLLKELATLLDRLMLAAAWVTLAFIVYATLSPIQDRPTVSTSPTFEHVVAFLVLGALFYLAYPRHPLFATLTALGSAVLLEFGQWLTPDRHARLDDVLEKLAGACIGLVIASVITWALDRRTYSDRQQG